MSSLAPTSGPSEAAESPRPTQALSGAQVAIASWGVLGVVLLFGQAIARLGARAVEAHEMPLDALEISVSVGWVLVNAYAEGYRAFQRRFSPRVVARALHLARNPRPLFVVFAPLFCMAFFHATRRARTIAWATTILVLCLIGLLRHAPQPWRGIVDGGVVIALGWGAAAIVVFFLRAVMTGREPAASPQVPET